MSSSKVKVAVVGYGHLGRWHAQKADQLENSELVAIVESFEQARENAQNAHPKIKVVSSLSEVIDEIDAAIVVTPTSTHFEIVKELLENKKHVFCEKPLCSTYEQAAALKELIDEKTVLQVGHSERYHNVWNLLKDEFAKVKHPYTAKFTRVAPFKGRATDVDVVQDLMIHDLDLLFYLLPGTPEKTKGFGQKIRTDYWDSVTSVLNFKEGSQAIITGGRNQVHEVRTFEVVHKGGTLFVDLMNNSYGIATDSQFDDGDYVKHFSYEKRDHLLEEQKDFYSSILEGTPISVTYQDGIKIVYVIDKILESLSVNGETISLAQAPR